jgi:serine protease Do
MRGEVIGINMAIVDADSGGSVGIGFAVPINTVTMLLPQLRQGRVARGHLGAQFHRRPIMDDEARQLGLPHAHGALIMSVDEHSAAGQAGLRAGDVIIELDGRDVAMTRDVLTRVALMSPGTRAVVKLFRDGCEQTRTVTIEEMPAEADVPADARVQDDDVNGLRLSELDPRVTRRLSLPSDVGGALVTGVAADSAADEAELLIGDVIRKINGRPVRSAAEATNELRQIRPRTSIFLVVWRHGAELFLVMRSD